MQKGLVIIPILIGILLIGGVIGAWYAKLIQIPNLPPPGCRYQQVQCIQAPCNPVLVCGNPSADQVAVQSPPTSFSPAPVDETANWKTYTNFKYGLKVKYPPSFIVQEFPVEPRQDQMSVFVKFIRKDGLDYPDTSISVGKTALAETEWIKSKELCPTYINNGNSCSPFLSGPLQNSIKFESLGRHYASVDTFFKRADALSFKKEKLLFDFSMGSKVSDKSFTAENLATYDSILRNLAILYAESIFSDKKIERGDKTYFNIDQSVISELPLKGPDGIRISNWYFGSPNQDYIVYSTFVKERGAGSQSDVWIYRLLDKKSINISNLAAVDPVVLNALTHKYGPDGLVPAAAEGFKSKYYFIRDRAWLENNLVLDIADGWSVLVEYLLYDFTTNKFEKIDDEIDVKNIKPAQ